MLRRQYRQYAEEPESDVPGGGHAGRILGRLFRKSDRRGREHGFSRFGTIWFPGGGVLKTRCPGSREKRGGRRGRSLPQPGGGVRAKKQEGPQGSPATIGG